MKFGAVIIYVILLFSGPPLNAQKKEIKFSRLSVEQGLSQGTVKCSFKDSQGFMWFGTRDGLNKYDGYKMTVYRNDSKDSSSISGSFIIVVYEDRNKNLWVGTTQGLNLFDRKSEKFRHFRIENQNPYIADIYQDKKENLWVASNLGLFIVDPSTKKITAFKHKDEDITTILFGGINKISEDREGNIWVGAPGGLDKYVEKTGSFEHYDPYPKGIKSALTIVQTVFVDSHDNVWVGMLGHGLSRFKPTESSFRHYIHDPNDPKSICHNDILSIAEDKQGNIWIGTQNGGLNVYNYSDDTFYHYQTDINDNSSLSSNSIHSIYKDDQGNIWLGTWAGGVSLYSPFADKFSSITRIMNFNHMNIYDVVEDNKGMVWLAVEDEGLVSYDRKNNSFKLHANQNQSFLTTVPISIENISDDTLALGYHMGSFAFFNKKRGTFTHYFPDPKVPENFQGIVKPSILKDTEGNIWIGDWGAGLSVYNRKEKTFTHFFIDSKNSHALNDGVVFSLLEDRDKNIWVGTEVGLHCYYRKKKQFVRYLKDDNNPYSISHNSVFSMYEDKSGRLWIGTGGGLNLLDRRNQRFKSYTLKDGLPSNVINSILEDDKENLWLGTNNGLSKFNPTTQKFRNFDIKDGLQGNEFNRNSAFKGADGTMYFTGTNGLTLFHPDSLRYNPFAPPVKITDLQIFNKSVQPGEDASPLDKPLSQSEEITIPYWQSVFSFEFAALNFIVPEKNKYAYKLEGFDKKWIYVGNRRLATYTNLNPGNYTFHVKASNNDGIWNQKGACIKIIITPPYWQTWWFRVGMTGIIVGAALWWYQARISSMKRQKEKLEEQVRERTKRILQQKEELESQSENLKEAYEELTQKKEQVEIQAEYLQDANNEIKSLYVEIKDSIRAAEVIQKSILPSEIIFKEHFPESFIFYKPKDVVSGDFYWFDQKDDQLIIAAVDCTGHGVSGAFMSINGYHLLNQAIYPYKKIVASEVLDRLTKSVIKELHQEEDSLTNNGMDIGLCVMDKDKSVIQFAGANNPLYVVRNKEIIKIPGNRLPIGMQRKDQFHSYDNHEIKVHKGDKIYLFSDGYADQIGKDSEKFNYHRFRELLLKIEHEKMSEQLCVLEKSLRDWQQDQEQLDDILVIGLEI